MSLTLKIDTENHTEEQIKFLQRVERVPAARQELNQYIADAATALTRRQFAANASRGNRHGWHSTGFWQRMAGGTVAIAEEDAALVRMPREVAQRRFGGMLTPQGGKKFLAIPAREEAYGITARDFPGLRFIPTGPDSAMLVQAAQSPLRYRKNKDGEKKAVQTKEVGGGVFYFLVKSATQAADESVLPTDEEYLAAARAGANAYIRKYL